MALTLLVLALGCGGGGTGPGTDPSDGGSPGGGDPGGTPTGPAFEGFDLTLVKGDFWEYAWDRSYDSRSSTTNVTRRSGHLRLTLGTPETIGGRTAFPVLYEGAVPYLFKADMEPRYSHLAWDEGQFLGSDDGLTWTVLFDADAGYWAGGGLFATFPDDVLLTASSSSFSNDYAAAASSVGAGVGGSRDRCETIGGYVFCGDDSYNERENEHYVRGVGCVGYEDYFFSSVSGGPGTGGGTLEVQTHIGLVAS